MLMFFILKRSHTQKLMFIWSTSLGGNGYNALGRIGYASDASFRLVFSSLMS
jgi:hypothetical protein